MEYILMGFAFAVTVFLNLNVLYVIITCGFIGWLLRGRKAS
jgi:chromate transport protein ChrA